MTRPEPKRASTKEEPELREQQRQQQRAESKALRAPWDMGDKIVALKRTRDPTDVNSFTGSTNPPPTERPATNKGKFSGELHAEEQLDITARDAARLQREGRAMDQ